MRPAEAELAELEFAVIDLETTGWSPGVAAITEIAAVRVRGGRRQGEFASLVNPGVPVPPGIEDLTGISDWMLAGAPGLRAVLPGLLDFADGCVLVAHNAPFDVGFLRAACAECGLAWPRWSPGVAAITEIAAVRVRGGRRQGEFASLVNPGVPVPPGIEDLTGISDWMLAAAPRLPAVLPGLLDFADGCVLVAHNAPFDVGFLRAACAECGLAWPHFTVLDTVMLARQLMDPDEVPDCKLGTLAGFFRARTAPSHRALADARATADVLGWLIRRLTHHGIRTLDQLTQWPDVVA